MAKPKRSAKRKPIYIPALPGEVSWLESDRYDRRAWSELIAGAPSINELVSTGQTLIPHFPALLQDLFFALFKYNLVWQKTDRVRQSAILNRTILTRLVPTPMFEALKSRTLLEEDKAAIAAIALGEQVIELIRSERLINRREMLDLWDVAHQEDDLEARAAAVKTMSEIVPEPAEGDEGIDPNRKLDELRDAAARAAQVSEARLKQKAQLLNEQLARSDQTELKRLQIKSAQLADEIDQAAQDSHDFGLEFGQGRPMPAGERIELGRRLARNKRIGELARMVGRFKLDARAIRRNVLERGAAEAYDVEWGAEVGRLIPAELLALNHPALRQDFRRRLLEGALLQYRLRDDEQKGRGPMVVCIDVSSSMQGDKELWAKAVSLTLMDIARRRRRLFRAVLFSSGVQSLKVLDLNRERRYQPELAKVLELAEYFPGGGTEFERPLDAAVALIEDRQLKRADIVMITDGESQVGAEWLADLRERKERLKFKIFAVLVDVGSSEQSTLAQFSDKMTSIHNLTAENARGIFLSV